MELPSIETSSVAVKIEENYSNCLVTYDGGIYSGRIISTVYSELEPTKYKIQIKVTRRQNELDHEIFEVDALGHQLTSLTHQQMIDIHVDESKVDCTTPCDENWLAKGQQCRVRWEGSVVVDGRVHTSALYNATLADRNIDGTYIVVYADGERDICVAADRIFGEPWIEKVSVTRSSGQISRLQFCIRNPKIFVGVCSFMICIIILSSIVAACNAEYEKAEYGEKTCFGTRNNNEVGVKEKLCPTCN